MGALMPGRVLNRKKRRMPCQLKVGSREHNALVLDLSPSGLFVQTSAKTRRGERIGLVVSDPQGAPMDLVVEVVRKKTVPPRLLAVAQGGVGVRILNAPERYYQFLTELGIAERFGKEAAPEEPSEPRFRVRVSQISGSRSRRLELAAPDADAARDQALEELGEGWKVLDVEAL